MDLIPILPKLRNLDHIMYPFYVCAAVRKFLFFLDPQRNGNSKPMCPIINDDCRAMLIIMCIWLSI